MKNLDYPTPTFTLENFEGTLDFLLHLIQKSEIDIYQIPLRKITEQFLLKWEEQLNPNVNDGAEFIGTTASLLWLKSKMLLPKHEQVEEIEIEDDPRFEIIHHLLDYCRFKEAGKELAEREQRQGAFYVRGMDEQIDPKKPLGVDHLGADDLAAIFAELLSKAVSSKGIINEEVWRVSDKIKSIHQLLKGSIVKLHELFSKEQCREEMIVTFLAILELMKMGRALVKRDENSKEVIVCAPPPIPKTP